MTVTVGSVLWGIWLCGILLCLALGAPLGCGGAGAGGDGDTGSVSDTLAGADEVGSDATGEPSGEAPSSERIREAWEAGRIDEKTAALYELLAQFSPDRLPPEYQSAQPLEGLASIVPMRIARARMSEYSEAEAAAVEAMLRSPEDPEWLVFPPDMPVQNAGVGAGGCRAGFTTAIPGARVIGAATDTRHFRIKAVAPAGASAEDKAALQKRIANALKTSSPGLGGLGSETFADYLDEVYEYYRDSLKMTEPTKMAAPAANGGRIPIYVALCDGAANDAFAEPNDGFIFVSVGLGFEDSALRRVVLPHEIFHVFQSAFDVPAVSRDWSWVVDASAVAVEDLVAPDVRRWSGAFATSPNLPRGFANPMDRFFQCPEEPLHTDYGGACRNRAGSAKHYEGAYSKFVVFKFLVRNYGLLMGEFWSKLKATGGDPTDLFDKQQMGELQLALLGDLSGKEYFDGEDRTAFFSPGSKGVDLAAGNAERYTFKLDPTAYKQSAVYRITPTQDSSLSKTLRKLDNGPQPLQPGGGTQRVLIEVPPNVSSISAGSCGVIQTMSVYFEFANCSDCTVNAVEVSADVSGPGRSLDATSSSADAFSLPGPVTFYEWTVPDGDPLPRFLLFVITNHGTGAGTFKAGLTVQTACTHDCMKEYGETLEGLQCVDFWCADDCVDEGTCAEWHDGCIKSYQDGLAGLPGTFCLWLCNGSGYPYPEEYSDPSCTRWLKSACDVSGTPDCKTIPSNFVPIPSWPTARCQTFLIAHEEDCD